MTPLRIERLQEPGPYTIAEVSRMSGICSWRISMVERGLVEATAEEIALLHDAIDELGRQKGSA